MGPSSSSSTPRPVMVISLDRRETPQGEKSPVPATDYTVELSDEARLRDQEVRLHEKAHLAALGGYATTPAMYTTARGPNGETVAVGGAVGVDLSPVPGDPRATLRKARVILNAARAPGDPSAADMRVAAEAYRLAQSAQDDLNEAKRAASSDLATA